MTDSVSMNMLRRTTVGDIIRRNAIRHPNKNALIIPSSKGEIVEYTWSEFNDVINKVANGLQSLGIGKGDKVGLFSQNTAPFVFLTYAVGRIGATIAPISAALKDKDLIYLIQHSDAKILFVEDVLVPAVNKISSAIADVKLGYLHVNGSEKKPDGWVGFDELLNNHTEEEPEVIIDIEDVASLTYTSGTESAPKAVMMSHGNLTNYLTTFFQWGILPNDVCLHILPLFYTGGLGTFNAPMMMGQSVVLPHSLEPETIVKLMKDYKVTFIVLPPTLWIRLLQIPGIEEAAKSMRVGVTFGSSISEGMIKGWNKIAPQMNWVSFYGQSETSCSGTVGHFRNINEICENDLGWVGKPYHDLEVRVVDESNIDMPVGEVGEIVFRGPAVFKGYYKDEEKTRTVFDGGWLHTGDLGRMNADGELFFADRVKDMIKSGGENISSASVEYAISSHSKVAEVAAFGIPHPKWMEALVVAVLPIQGKSVMEDEIIKHCKENLPRFKVPKRIIFVEDFPRTASGKIMKRELRKKYNDFASLGIED